MLLAIDAGNTNITVGLFDASKLASHWRLETQNISDESWNKFLQSIPKFRDVILSNVVPSIQSLLQKGIVHYGGKDPLVVTPKTAQIPLRVDHPEEVGADRLCNAVAAWEKWKQATIVVDFGTATTLDIITAAGEYGGGAIVPGPSTAAKALSQSTAQLPIVEFAKPKHIVGRNTEECIQAGLYYGYVGMVDHLIRLSQKEEGCPMKVVATGGLAASIAEESKMIEVVEPHLTLEGLNFIWQRNVVIPAKAGI